MLCCVVLCDAMPGGKSLVADVLMLSRLHTPQQVCPSVSVCMCRMCVVCQCMWYVCLCPSRTRRIVMPERSIARVPSLAAHHSRRPTPRSSCTCSCSCYSCYCCCCHRLLAQELAAKGAPSKGFKHKQQQQQPVTRALIVLPYLSIGRCTNVAAWLHERCDVLPRVSVVVLGNCWAVGVYLCTPRLFKQSPTFHIFSPTLNTP